MSYFESIYLEDIPSRAVVLYMYLKDRAGKDGESWYAINTMARDLSLSRSTVKRALADLKKAGYLEVEPRYLRSGGCSSNRYRLKK